MNDIMRIVLKIKHKFFLQQYHNTYYRSKRMITNKRKQKKTIATLEFIRVRYDKLNTIHYTEEREKYREGENSELRHSSEDFETFETRKSRRIEELLKFYNTLNEKLPHHMRLDLLL